VKNSSIILTILSLIILLNVSIAEVFPVDGGEADDFSSPFGPRNLNGYDFHEGLDIGDVSVGTNVYAISDGKVYFVGSESVILYREYYDDYTKYLHIKPSVIKDSSVDEGDIIGTIKDISLDIQHLHFGWIPEGKGIPEVGDKNMDNPVQILWQGELADLTPMPKIVDKNGNEFESGDHINIYPDEDSNGKYFKFGVRAEDDELDIRKIQLHLSGYDYDDDEHYTTSDLLKNGNEIDQPNVVYYHTQFHCDVANPISCLFIEPNVFYRTDPYHTVYFKFYLENEAFDDVDEYVTVEIDLWDRMDEPVVVNNLCLPTCIDCNPPASAPGPPILISANYLQYSRNIKLEYVQDWSNPFPKYFKIYRCLSSENMTDNDVIGICSHPSEYYDDSAELKPGVSYKYAVAGVNYAGEGYNSNMLSEIYGELLPATISSNTQLDGVYYSDGTTISNGYTVTIAPGTRIKINSGKSIVNNGIINAQGTSPNPIKFSGTGNVWNSIELRNSSQFSYCLFENGAWIYIKNQPSTFSHCVYWWSDYQDRE
jgi:murein DD-endopeptidase MepM/ murein hydrolase activator NlpD